MGHKGYYGQYTGNAKWSKNHADTKVTKSNYKASERDDAAHIDYLKRDVDYDNKHGHSDENMTADEKHISKLAGDMKYDKKHHSPAKHNSASGRSHIHSKYHTSYEGDATFPKDKKKGGAVVKGDHGPSRFKKQKQEAEANKENKQPTKMLSPVKTTASAGRSGHPRHMQAGADNSGNPNAASSDEYWRKHQQLRHHQSAPTKMVSPLSHDREDKKEHLHMSIKKGAVNFNLLLIKKQESVYHKEKLTK